MIPRPALILALAITALAAGWLTNDYFAAAAITEPQARAMAIQKWGYTARTKVVGYPQLDKTSKPTGRWTYVYCVGQQNMFGFIWYGSGRSWQAAFDSIPLNARNNQACPQ